MTLFTVLMQLKDAAFKMGFDLGPLLAEMEALASDTESLVREPAIGAVKEAKRKR